MHMLGWGEKGLQGGGGGIVQAHFQEPPPPSQAGSCDRSCKQAHRVRVRVTKTYVPPNDRHNVLIIFEVNIMGRFSFKFFFIWAAMRTDF